MMNGSPDAIDVEAAKATAPSAGPASLIVSGSADQEVWSALERAARSGGKLLRRQRAVKAHGPDAIVVEIVNLIFHQ